MSTYAKYPVPAGSGGGGGGGNVTGPGSSTDNAVARFDGTTGQLIQNSGVIVDDSNNVSGANNLSISGILQVANTAPGTSYIVAPTAQPLRIKSLVGNADGLRLSQDNATDDSRMVNFYSGNLIFGTANTDRLYLSSSGNLLFSTDAANTIGASGANRPSDIYASQSMSVATATPGIIFNSTNERGFTATGTGGAGNQAGSVGLINPIAVPAQGNIAGLIRFGFLNNGATPILTTRRVGSLAMAGSGSGGTNGIGGQFQIYLKLDNLASQPGLFTFDQTGAYQMLGATPNVVLGVDNVGNLADATNRFANAYIGSTIDVAQGGTGGRIRVGTNTAGEQGTLEIGVGGTGVPNSAMLNFGLAASAGQIACTATGTMSIGTLFGTAMEINNLVTITKNTTVTNTLIANFAAPNGYQYHNIEISSTTAAYTFGSNTSLVLVDPVATLATKTITMPAVALDGLLMIIVSGDTAGGTTVTALTVLPNSGQTINNVPVTLLANTTYKWFFSTTNNNWYRIA